MSPGTYMVKLAVDGQEFTQKLEVRKDPSYLMLPTSCSPAAHLVGNSYFIDKKALLAIVVVNRQLRCQRAAIARNSSWPKFPAIYLLSKT